MKSKSSGTGFGRSQFRDEDAQTFANNNPRETVRLVRIYVDGSIETLWPNEKGARMEIDMAPVNLRREDLIARLQENLDAEKKEREDKAAKEDADRKAVEDFLSQNLDRVATMLRSYYGPGQGWDDFLSRLRDKEFSGDNWKPVDSVPDQKESDLEKFVRVLGMSSDETVSLTPDQPIWDLL